jgi:glycosyltransferase involved in cell wall biosynthesis
LKICFISGALPEVSCGIGDYVDSLARALTRRGNDVAVVTTASPALRSPVDYRVVPLRTSWSLGDAGLVAAAVRRENPDVLHLQFPGVGYGRGFGACFAPWVVRVRGPKLLLAVTLHEFPTYRLRHRARLAAAVSACDLIIAPDPRILTSVERHLSWRPGLTTSMIPVAANVWPSRVNSRPSASTEGRELTIGYWGFLRPDKGVDLLLDAFARILEVRPARLVLAGDEGPDEEYIASIWHHAEALGITSAIRTTGKLSAEQLSAELQSFDVCVLPFRDGLSQNRTTYAGARAHGLYVVTTGLRRRGFDDASNTTFVPPDDHDALVAGILEAPEHPRRRGVVSGEDAWDRIADLHIEAYGTRPGSR